MLIVGWWPIYQLLSVSGFLLSANGYTLDGPKMEKTTLMSLQLRQLQDIIYRLNGIRLDSTEYACLKALLLFKPGLFRPLHENANFIKMILFVQGFLVPVWFKSNNFYLNPVSVLIYPLTCCRCEGTAWLVTSGGIAGPGTDNAVWLCQQPETSENAIWKTTTATSGTAQREFSRSWGHFLPENNWQHSNRKNLVWHV